jgi:transposase-like protein
MKEDLENLLPLGVNIGSITCGRHKSLLKAINKACKNVIVQRCIIHIQRMCRIWQSSKPKNEAGLELRRIISRLHTINAILYIENERIPKSTNGIDSFFGHLKDNLSIHRGLSNKHRKSFIQWCLYFRNSSNSRFLKP